MVSLGPVVDAYRYPDGRRLLTDGSRYMLAAGPFWTCAGGRETWVPPNGLTDQDLAWVAAHLELAGAHRHDGRPAPYVVVSL